MIEAAWDIFSDSALFVLIGFGVAGVAHFVLAGGVGVSLLEGTGRRSVFWAALVGLPLPLCSCSVLPTALTLRRKGAGHGAVLSFLISTPETSVTSVLLTYSLLGPRMAIARPVAACVTAVVAGLIENFRRGGVDDSVDGGASGSASESRVQGKAVASPGRISTRMYAALRYAYVELFDDIFGWLMVGILAAAVIRVWISGDMLMTLLGGQLQSSLMMIAIGIPLYVCAEASTPIAASLVAAGMSPGAALVFLLVGPATNLGAIGILNRELGRGAVVVYLATIVACALGIGLILDYLPMAGGGTIIANGMGEAFFPDWMKAAGAAAFLTLGVGTVVRKRYLSRLVGIDAGGCHDNACSEKHS